MHTILGAGGAIATALLKELVERGERIRLVGRNPRPSGGAAELVAADISDFQQTMKAVAGSSIVYLLIGLKYDIGVWRRVWPKIMANTIEACKKNSAKLIFFDSNVRESYEMLYQNEFDYLFDSTKFAKASG
jgi:nucleoside-diphosphate-sugar epimerase